MTGGVDASHRLVLFHTMDPRGRKLGGIETHVRLVLANHPASSSLLFVGIDELGDLTPGRIVLVAIGDRSIEFLPVAGVPAAAINKAAKRLRQSTTLRYALGLLRHFGAIRRAVRGRPASSEVERFEIALVPKLLGLPLVLIVHNEGTRKDAMDTLLKKYWVLHRLNERIALEVADRVFAVNPSIAARIAHLSTRLGDKTEVMSVSVDTRCFKPTPFAAHDDAFHVCFAGRLDAFKDPDLMFATLARLAQRLAARTTGRFRRLVFDYVGASEPKAFATFADISGLCVRHGILPPAEVARVMVAAHAGLITSFFEGMPCYLLEMIASGRPVVAVALPQFTPVVVPGVSGALVERAADPVASADRLATRLLETAESIDADGLDPATIARLAGPFGVDTQLRRLFDRHRGLAIGEADASAATASASSA